MFKRIIFTALSVALCLGATKALWAQELNFSADRKITGQFFKPQTARTYQRGAIQHAQVLQQYGQQHKAIPPETAKEHAGQVRHNLEAVKKEMAKLGPEIKSDAVATKLFAEIQAHHAKALEACHMLDAESAKAHPEGGAVAGCCTDMLKELNAADELHEKLLKHLKFVPPGAPKTPAPSAPKK